MAGDAPDHISLLAGETTQALIQQDREVKFLREAVAAMLGIGAVVVLLIVIDLIHERPLQGLGGGMALTFAFLFGPLLYQRLFTRPVPYLLTNRRLILGQDGALELARIARLRVWLTSITIHAGGQKIRLVNLVNPPAVARLLRDTIAANRTTA
ncbi:MAG: hypothetical protein JJT99_13460 [Rhodobacteraceae bacterium]|nr:hypothetical protein [Paracoccaceae bacterium]